jgi:Protein of unknown function (DUF2997)
MAAKKIEIRIMPDGRVVAETIGVKGAKCEDYMKTVEEIIEGKIVKSELKPEYYMPEETPVRDNEKQKIENEK